MKANNKVVMCVPLKLGVGRIKMVAAIGKHHETPPSTVLMLNMSDIVGAADMQLDAMLEAAARAVINPNGDTRYVIVTDVTTEAMLRAAHKKQLIDLSVEYYDFSVSPPTIFMANVDPLGRIIASQWSAVDIYDDLLNYLVDWGGECQ